MGLHVFTVPGTRLFRDDTCIEALMDFAPHRHRDSDHDALIGVTIASVDRVNWAATAAR
jgi:hypothetical protein